MKALDKKKPVWNDEKILKGRFSFLCNPSKDIFSSTSQSDVYFCTQCQKKVYEVDTQEDFELHAQQRNCVLVRTSGGVSLIAEPNTPKELFIFVEAGQYGPFPFQNGRDITIGSVMHAHIKFPARENTQKVYIQLRFIDAAIHLLRYPGVEIQVHREGSNVPEYIEGNRVSFNVQDRFSMKVDMDWIPFSFSVQDVISRPPEIYLGGVVHVEPAQKEVSFFSSPLKFIKTIFSKKK